MILATLGAFVALTTASPTATRLPGTVAGGVVILTPEDPQHRRLRILVDSGGYDLIDAGAADALHLRRAKVALGGKDRYTVAFPNFVRRAIPTPKTAWLIARPGVLREGFAAAIDATLGPAWLLEHAITVDYPHGAIALGRASESGTSVLLR